jgi:serine/threonine-protein kinase
MGVVYLAEREAAEFQQRVALKLVRHLGAGHAVHRRFAEERRILALLEHPRIAHLIDGGLTSDGVPYFAMELVDGEPIDAYCDVRGLSIDQRIDLFIGVCEAVQYAHEHLVIHRDLKPSNILVRADGQLKLLDFGIAKLLDPLRPSDEAGTTQTGVLALTPEYAAPEQIRGQAVSTATDTYALGVLLYLLLTGRRPYDVRGKTPAEVERIVCDVEPPRASAVAAEKLRRRLRGDLDIIVMKALQKDPRRRYPSAAALRDDLRRYRTGLPVLARPDSAIYRLRKFTRRHVVPVVAGIAALILLTAAAFRERVLRSRAEEGTRKAEQTTDFMFDLFDASANGRYLGDSITARELVDRGVAQARSSKATPALRAQMFDVLGRLEAQVGNFAAARPLLTEALAMRKTLYGDDHTDVATTLDNLADVMRATGDMAGAARLRREELRIRRKISGDADAKTTNTLVALAGDLHSAGDARAAEPLLAEWWAAVAKAPAEITTTRLRQLNRMGTILQYGGQFARAESLFREELSVARQLYGDQNYHVAVAMSDVARVLDAAGRDEEAEPLMRQEVETLRRAYPDGSPRLASDLRLWSAVLAHLSRFGEAEAPLREGLALARRFNGDNSLEATHFREDLAHVLTMLGRYDEAVPLSRQAKETLEHKYDARSQMVVYAGVLLGDALRGEGKFGEAEPLLLAGYERFKNPKGLLPGYRRTTLRALVRLYEAEHKLDEAARYRALDSGRPSATR